ncbi:TetR/AcrR family transcriptional regulator [Deltaproteobacteria bacterium OttesenSCG-928-M10]|nr:TetR/AcrR family transcriptional regulator [Deltaproteobacteria bacterium OttesenSCG-928-M10]
MSEGSTKRVPKKETIERAAMELFARYGFAGATIKDIAGLAGVTEGALYRHYSGKEELAAALFDRELSAIHDSLARSLAEPGAPANKLRAVIEYIYGRYHDDPWPLLFVILNFQHLQGDSRPDEKKHIYDYVTQYITKLFRGRPGHRDLEFLATLVTGLVIQPVIFHYYGRLPRHPLEYVDEIWRSCCLLAGLS